MSRLRVLQTVDSPTNETTYICGRLQNAKFNRRKNILMTISMTTNESLFSQKCPQSQNKIVAK